MRHWTYVGNKENKGIGAGLQYYPSTFSSGVLQLDPMGRSNCFNFSIHQLLGRKSLDMATNKEHGINANNQEFNKYEQVQKDQSYKLVENETEDQFDEEFKIDHCYVRLGK